MLQIISASLFDKTPQLYYLLDEKLSSFAQKKKGMSKNDEIKKLKEASRPWHKNQRTADPTQSQKHHSNDRKNFNQYNTTLEQL
jgi:hypothetical protein